MPGRPEAEPRVEPDLSRLSSLTGSRAPVTPPHQIAARRKRLRNRRTDRTATHAAAAGRRGSGRSRRMGMRIGASAADPGPRMDAARSLRGARPSAPGRRRERRRGRRARGDAARQRRSRRAEDRTASPFTSTWVKVRCAQRFREKHDLFILPASITKTNCMGPRVKTTGHMPHRAALSRSARPRRAELCQLVYGRPLPTLSRSSLAA